MNALALAPQHAAATPRARALAIAPPAPSFTSWAPADVPATVEFRVGIASVVGGLAAIASACAAIPLLLG